MMLAAALLAATMARATEPTMIEFTFQVRSCEPTKRAAPPSGYVECRLRAVLDSVQGGRLEEAVGQEFSASPFIYGGPFENRPRGLWVSTQFEAAVPAAGSRWTARCRIPTEGALSASVALSGYGDRCQLDPVSNEKWFIDGREVTKSAFQRRERWMFGQSSWYCKDKVDGGETGWISRDFFLRRWRIIERTKTVGDPGVRHEIRRDRP